MIRRKLSTCFSNADFRHLRRMGIEATLLAGPTQSRPVRANLFSTISFDPLNSHCLVGTEMTSSHPKNISVWKDVPLGPRDPILGITEAFKADVSPSKINLGVGAYRDDSGKPFVLKCVKGAEQLIPQEYPDKEYLEISGLKEFKEASALLAYGSSVSLEQVAICQSLSGTGALRLGGIFLSKFHQHLGKDIYVPSPTWGNHPNIFRDSGLVVKSYRYWNPQTNGLDLNGMLGDLEKAPPNSIVLLHACAHNPTGVDPTFEEWQEIHSVIRKKSHTAFFDMAYQGFATGDIAKDAQAVRYFVEKMTPVLLAQSYAKNMGLYGERIGALTVPCQSKEEAESVLSQLRMIARTMYSNPPIHGARIVSLVLNRPELRSMWEEEVSLMANRIIQTRSSLRSELEKLGSALYWSHITRQIGMFCYTGLDADQVARLTADYHVYLTKDGRISMAGVNSSNVGRLAKAIHDVTKSQ